MDLGARLVKAIEEAVPEDDAGDMILIVIPPDGKLDVISTFEDDEQTRIMLRHVMGQLAKPRRAKKRRRH